MISTQGGNKQQSIETVSVCSQMPPLAEDDFKTATINMLEEPNKVMLKEHGNKKSVIKLTQRTRKIKRRQM